jgi:hypothetical protein
MEGKIFLEYLGKEPENPREHQALSRITIDEAVANENAQRV